MKIALIRKKFAIQGGAERHVSDFLKGLVDNGHEVHILANKWEALKGVTFHTIPVFSLGSFFKTLSFVLNVKPELERVGFDIVQSNERTLSQDIYRAGDGCHKEWLEQRGRYASWMKRLSIKISPFHLLMCFLERKIFSQGNYKKIIAISKMGKEEIRKHYSVPADDIQVIYNGVDLKKFQPVADSSAKEKLRKEYGIGKDDLLLLFVGSGFERKGVKFLLQALGKLKRDKVKLLVVGKGRANAYAGLINSLGIKEQVVFTGVIEERERVFQCADIFVFPTMYEPFGNVHLEALATGLPVITTSRSGAAETITSKVNGFVVEEPSHVDEIAESIEYLYDDSVRKQVGIEARKLAEQFTLERNTREILELYNEVLRMKS